MISNYSVVQQQWLLMTAYRKYYFSSNEMADLMCSYYSTWSHMRSFWTRSKNWEFVKGHICMCCYSTESLWWIVAIAKASGHDPAESHGYEKHVSTTTEWQSFDTCKRMQCKVNVRRSPPLFSHIFKWWHHSVSAWNYMTWIFLMLHIVNNVIAF